MLIGDGTKIWHFCHICKGARIGKDCVIGQNVYIGPSVCIGNSCRIQNNVSIFEGVNIEDWVFIGPSVTFTNVKYPRADGVGFRQQTYVEENVTIGANATILCGVTIGKRSFVGAGSVVTKDVVPGSLVIGVPAKNVWRKGG